MRSFKCLSVTICFVLLNIYRSIHTSTHPIQAFSSCFLLNHSVTFHKQSCDACFSFAGTNIHIISAFITSIHTHICDVCINIYIFLSQLNGVKIRVWDAHREDVRLKGCTIKEVEKTSITLKVSLLFYIFLCLLFLLLYSMSSSPSFTHSLAFLLLTCFQTQIRFFVVQKQICSS